MKVFCLSRVAKSCMKQSVVISTIEWSRGLLIGAVFLIGMAVLVWAAYSIWPIMEVSPPIQIIPGEYSGVSKYANETLILHSDFTYDQAITYRLSSKFITSHGKWHYNDALLSFDQNFIVPQDGEGVAAPTYGTDGLPAEIWLGQVYLGVEKINDHTFYRKQK